MKSDPKECLYCQNNETLNTHKLSYLHFHLSPKYVDRPDYGSVFRMNPGKVYLTVAEYEGLMQ